MKDALGNEVSLGDTIVFCGYNTTKLRTGIVKKITRCTVRTDYDTKHSDNFVILKKAEVSE